MRPVINTFFSVVVGIFFIVGLTLLITGTRDLTVFIQKSESKIVNTGVVYKDNTGTIRDIDSITYDELMGILINTPSIAIEINGTVYSAGTITEDTFDFSSVPNKTYKRQEVIGANGLVTKLIFTST